MVDRKAKRFVMRWHEDASIYCGQCVQVCRFDAIHLPPDSGNFAATGREDFTKTFGNEDDINKPWTHWPNATIERIRQAKTRNRRPIRLTVMGIGQEMFGDDAAGVEVARRLQPLLAITYR